MEENCDWIGNPARCTFDSKQNRIVPDANIIPIIPEKKHSSYNWRISCKNRITKTGQIFVLRNRICGHLPTWESVSFMWIPLDLQINKIYDSSLKEWKWQQAREM